MSMQVGVRPQSGNLLLTTKSDMSSNCESFIFIGLNIPNEGGSYIKYSHYFGIVECHVDD